MKFFINDANHLLTEWAKVGTLVVLVVMLEFLVRDFGPTSEGMPTLSPSSSVSQSM